MLRRLTIVAAGLSGAVILAFASMIPAQGTQAPARVPCPAGSRCTYAKVIIQDTGSDSVIPNPNQFLVLDKNGAPMFWINVGGAFSGGTDVCVTSLTLRNVSCLTASGGLMLSDSGTRPVTLTARELRSLLRLIRK